MKKGTLDYSGESGFWNARFDVVYKNLNPVNAEKFKALPLKKKKLVVAKFIHKGYMI